MSIRKVSNIQLKLEMLLKEYTQSINTPPTIVSSTPSSNTGGAGLRIGNHKCKFDYLAEFDENDSKYLSGSGKSILKNYLEDPKIEHKLDLDSFEKPIKSSMMIGELSHLARDILSIQLTVVASESTFNIGGRILNKWRSSYIPKNRKKNENNSLDQM
ncbi:LOW QUALITY PROTEIN: hypothetical protein Cgig2_006565 [Carnegiea gigantea]|uniref:HAT C-terminal dimerisation domain-containing protein n=1 Tax=Carnegiea gigantea TaxID=171969 RepID=A0A9Q1GJR0_9CARY|nr:LOW QUALITY PROTEIN: hypothetical protein Cgig2_006565 [Carnegiea gigantea]